MAIRGSLAEAGLSEVLQLLALGRKGGCLSVARPGDFGSIYLDYGRIVHAGLVNRRDRLGQRLLRAGDLDAADLEAALAEQETDPSARLGELLLRRGAIDHAALARHTRAQSEEAALELLAWAQGTFSFEPDVRVSLPVAPIGLDVSALLMEAARRTDERARIATRVSADDVVYALTASAPCTPAGTLDVARVAWGDAPLSADGRVAVTHVDGRRDVAALVDAAGVGDFAVRHALFVLLGLGLIEPAGTSAPRSLRDASRVVEHRNLGVAFYRAGLLEEAAREFRRVLELVPGDAHARYFSGVIALRGGDADGAMHFLSTAAAAPGAHGAVHIALAATHALCGRVVDAHASLNEAARRGLAGDARLRALRASLHLRADDVAAAAQALGDVAADDARPAVWHHYAAVVAAKQGNRARVAEALDAARRVAPRAAPVLANLAAVAAHEGDGDAALRWAAQAIDEDPALAAAHKTAGDAYYRAGRHADAADAFERALALTPSLGPETWLRLGNVRLREGDRDAAAAAWRRALALRPDHAIARANLDALGDAVGGDAVVGDAPL